MAREGTCEDPKRDKHEDTDVMRIRMFGNFRVPLRGSAADLSEIVPGALPAGRYRSGAALRVAFPWISGEKQNRHDRDHACSGKMECYCLTGGGPPKGGGFKITKNKTGIMIG